MPDESVKNTVQETMKQRVALVTGASRGIGAAIALRLSKAGFYVVGTATTEAGAASISAALGAQGSNDSNAGKGHGSVLQVNDAGQCASLVDGLIQSQGGIDVLVNNAGITRDGLAMRMKDDDWSAVIETNLSAVFRLSRLVMRPMMKARHGRIINITSVVGSSGNPGQANYAAAKAGVAGMTRALAIELGSRGITVNCVAPGFIQTDMTNQLNEAQVTALQQQIALGKFGQPEDVAAAVAFLAGGDANYITGVTLHVNGGMYMAA